MKKIKKILLSLILLVCGSSISQTVTPKKSLPKQKQESNVVIDTTTARLIANDLVSGDVCKAELKLVKSNLSLIKKEVGLKDNIIATMEEQKDDLLLIISKKDEIIEKEKEISKTFENSLSKQKRTTFIYKLFTGLGIISTTLLLIKP